MRKNIVLAALAIVTGSILIAEEIAPNTPAPELIPPPPAAYHPANTNTLNRAAGATVATNAPPQKRFPVCVIDLAVLQLPNGQRLLCMKDSQLAELARRWPAVVVTNTIVLSDGSLTLPQDY